MATKKAAPPKKKSLPLRLRLTLRDIAKHCTKCSWPRKFRLPIVCLVDTPGAYPGMKAEERGQAEAIAFNLREMSRLETPIVSCVIGEGGSGGALGIAVADRVAMLEYSWYSVISPEGCAAILWKVANDETSRSAAEASTSPRPRTSRTGSSMMWCPSLLGVPTGLPNGQAKPWPRGLIGRWANWKMSLPPRSGGIATTNSGPWAG